MSIPQVMSFIKPRYFKNCMCELEYLKNHQKEIEGPFSKVDWTSCNLKKHMPNFDNFKQKEIKDAIRSSIVHGSDIRLFYYLLLKTHEGQYASKMYLIDEFIKSLMMMSEVAERAIQEQNIGNMYGFNGNEFYRAHEEIKKTGCFLNGMIETPIPTFDILESQFLPFRSSPGYGMNHVSTGACNVIIYYIRDHLKKCKRIKYFDESMKNFYIANKKIRNNLKQILESH